MVIHSDRISIECASAFYPPHYFCLEIDATLTECQIVSLTTTRVSHFTLFLILQHKCSHLHVFCIWDFFPSIFAISITFFR